MRTLGIVAMGLLGGCDFRSEPLLTGEGGDGIGDEDAGADADADTDCADRDGDGFPALDCGGDDCDDSDPTIFPGAPKGAAWVVATVDETAHHQEGAIALDAAGRPLLASWGWTGEAGSLEYFAWDGGGWSKEVVDPLAEMPSPGMAVEADGTVAIAYGVSNYETGDGLGRFRFAERRDDVWTVETVDPIEGRGDPTAMVLDGDGHAHAVYIASNEGNLVYATNASGDWTVETVRAGELSHGNITEIDLVLDANGAAHTVFAEFGYLAYATNESGVWSESEVVGAPGYAASLAIAPNGTLHAVYGGNEIQLRHATREGGTWEVETIDEEPDSARCTDVEVDAAGAVHVIFGWYGEQGLGYATNASGDWVLESADPEPMHEWCAMAVDAAGNVHAAYAKANPADLKYALRRSTDDGIDQDCDGDPAR